MQCLSNHSGCMVGTMLEDIFEKNSFIYHFYNKTKITDIKKRINELKNA